jgi:phosphatidylglycerophosphate synthase
VVIPVRHGLTASLGALAALLVVLAGGRDLGVPAGVVGLACGTVLCAAVARGCSEAGAVTLGPADLVTLTRASLACVLAALVADAALGQPASAAIVPLATVALLLDAVDGRVARASGTATAFGARFDGEADAWLLLVLSVHVAGTYGGWVLAIGGLRYAFAASGWWWLWLRGALPPRHWRKVVAGFQGVALTVAAADVLPAPGTHAVLVVALALLTESFGRDVLWAWRHRAAAPEPAVAVP